MEDYLEEQDIRVEYLKSFYEEDFEVLVGKVQEITDGDYRKLEEDIDSLLQDFSITCKKLYHIKEVTFYFELLLAEYDLPSLLEFADEQ